MRDDHLDRYTHGPEVAEVLIFDCWRQHSGLGFGLSGWLPRSWWPGKVAFKITSHREARRCRQLV